KRGCGSTGRRSAPPKRPVRTSLIRATPARCWSSSSGTRNASWRHSSARHPCPTAPSQVDLAAMSNVRVGEVESAVAGAYCGRLFAGAGAEVVCAEPTAGSRLRGGGRGGGGAVNFLWEYLAVGK